MININSKFDCCGCGACNQICPQQCINMEFDSEGFLYPRVIEKDCIKCGRCLSVCPCLIKRSKSTNSGVYACKAKDDDLRLKSSSGGIFTLLSEWILSNNGVVFGAAFDKSMQVNHISVERLDELYKLRGSKYVQSNIGNSYKYAETILKSGKQVLFSGTPCQISGLKSYLKKEYDNLLCVDIICHGTPSPLVWKHYVEHKELINGLRIGNAYFRDKKWGWNKLCLTINYENDITKNYKSEEDAYYAGFLDNLFLRPSCHECRFRNFTSGSDITIGDYWGIKKMHPHMYDDIGVSALFINTLKGEDVFSKINNQIIVQDSSLENVIECNPNVIYDTIPHRNRKRFFESLVKNEWNIEELIMSNLNFTWKKDSVLKFGLFGSYTSRCIIQNMIKKSNNKFSYQYSNSSLISLMSDESRLPQNLIMPENPFRAEMLRYDFNKEFKNNLNKISLETDILIVDFMEERFHIVKQNDGFVTKSVAFDDSNLDSVNILYRDNHDTISMWENSCLKFIKILKEYFNSEQVILVELYLCKSYGDIYCKKDYLNVLEIEKINKLLKHYYNFFKVNFKGVKTISLEDNRMCFTDKNHIYGMYPEHYNIMAYNILSDKLYNEIQNMKNKGNR